MNAPMYMPQPSYPTPSAPGGGTTYPPPGGVPVYPPTSAPYPSAGAPSYGGGSYGGGGSAPPPTVPQQYPSYAPPLQQQGTANVSPKVRKVKTGLGIYVCFVDIRVYYTVFASQKIRELLKLTTQCCEIYIL